MPLYRFTRAAPLFDSDPETAEAVLRRIVADEPHHARALNNLGVSIERRGKPWRSAALYRRAQQADPTLAAARRNAARFGPARLRMLATLTLSAGALAVSTWLCRRWMPGLGLPIAIGILVLSLVVALRSARPRLPPEATF